MNDLYNHHSLGNNRKSFISLIRSIVKPSHRGFTIFFAVLVASLSLAVGVVIYDLLIRSLSLSQISTQSQYSIYAADTGAECALYWDLKYASISPSDQDGSAFATSSKILASDVGTGQAVVCNNQNITTASSISGFNNTVGNSNAGWEITSTANAATTTFWISMASAAAAPCAKVEVGKSGNPSQTTIVSHGYNTCAAGNNLRVERILQVNY
jgi:hypothetical protein